MAKTLAILASLLLFFVLTVICVPAKDRNDPSLEIIKHEDAEEGYVYQVKDRIQNEIKTKDTHEERTGRASPAEEVQQEQHEPNNQNSISATESESETQEFIPEEDLDDTIFEYNVDEKQNDVNIEVADQQGDIEDTKEHTFTDINEVIDTVDEETETENPEHVTEAELQEQETEEKKLRIEINDIVQNIPEHENEEEIEEISEGEEYDQEENNEIYESQNSQSEDLSYEYEEEEEMEENEVQNSHEYAEEGEEENNTEENEEELNEEQNMEEGYEENNNEETFEDENQPEKDEAENAEEANEGETEGTEGQSEESEDESDRNAWFEEGMNVDENEEEEENDFPNVKSPSIIYTAIAELTKYDEDNDNTEYFDDGIYDMVEPPEDLNTVQTYPVEATDDAVTTQEDTVCSLPTQSGPCKAYFQRYFYNSNSGECELFIYGGCNGNANNFNTLNECESTCVRRVHL